uniref:Death domain-containing protein n=1 Tax=Plectus sambesii TaxID=2011161 RepID=A0A914VG62_9BILA
MAVAASASFVAMGDDAAEHAGHGGHDEHCCEEETALHCAAARGHLECVQSLLDSGAPVDAQDRSGQTALHLALRRSHIDIALLLMTKGCRLDIQDGNGDTALHVSCKAGLLTAAQTLCHLGSPVDILNTSSLSPLHIAAKEGHIEIVRSLCLAGCNINGKNKDGLTAEIMALAQENTQVGTLLAKLKSESTKDLYVEQLCAMEAPLRRIKLKLFGHSMSGKTRLTQTLQTGVIGTFLGAVSRRFSETATPKEDGSSDRLETNNNKSETWRKHSLEQKPAHANYTRGIEVQSLNIPGAGEFSVWEFGGYDPYHMAYDHFVGNTDCVHVVMFRATDPTEVQYKQVLYWINFLKGRQRESITVKNNREGEELFTDVVCFGSREVAAVLTLGIDLSVAQLQLPARCELAALLDPSDSMGRDWSILAVKLNLADQLPEVDSTGQSLSRTDQLLAEWALQSPDNATVGNLCQVLTDLGRADAVDALYRTVPLYLFAPLDDAAPVHLTDCGDSGVASSNHSQSTSGTSQRSTSTVSR